jgi:hypothetical protein
MFILSNSVETAINEVFMTLCPAFFGFLNLYERILFLRSFPYLLENLCPYYKLFLYNIIQVLRGSNLGLSCPIGARFFDLFLYYHLYSRVVFVFSVARAV